MYFSQETMKVGGRVRVPDSIYNKSFGEIIGTTVLGITVKYNKDTGDEQTCFYRFNYLERLYAPKTANRAELNDDLPWNF